MSTEGYTRDSVLAAVRSGKSLSGQKIKGIDLSSSDLRGADLRGVHFRYSDLRQADLRGADLREANLRHVNLLKADLREADLRGADLTHADIRGARFDEARLKGTKFGSTRGLSTKVFFSQALLDKLLGDGRADLAAGELLVASRSERWKLVPAARVVGLEAGHDTQNIIGRLLTEDALKTLGLDVYRDTAAEGDNVYKLETGMIGEPLHQIVEAVDASEVVLEDAAPPAAAPAAAPAAVAKSPEQQKKSDQELINDFLLKRLTTS